MKHVSTLLAGLLIGAARCNFPRRLGPERWLGYPARQHENGRLGRSRQSQLGHEGRRGSLPTSSTARTCPISSPRIPTRDFQIKAEFWTDEEANSGIFIRCEETKKIDSKVLLRGQYLRQRAGPQLRHRRDRRRRQGRSDARKRPASEHLRDHRAGSALRCRAQRPEDRRRAGLKTPQRPTSRFNTVPCVVKFRKVQIKVL